MTERQEKNLRSPLVKSKEEETEDGLISLFLFFFSDPNQLISPKLNEVKRYDKKQEKLTSGNRRVSKNISIFR